MKRGAQWNLPLYSEDSVTDGEDKYVQEMLFLFMNSGPKRIAAAFPCSLLYFGCKMSPSVLWAQSWDIWRVIAAWLVTSLVDPSMDVLFGAGWT